MLQVVIDCLFGEFGLISSFIIATEVLYEFAFF